MTLQNSSRYWNDGENCQFQKLLAVARSNPDGVGSRVPAPATVTVKDPGIKLPAGVAGICDRIEAGTVN